MKPEELADSLPGATIIQAFAKGDDDVAYCFTLVLSDGTVVKMVAVPSIQFDCGIEFRVSRKMSKSDYAAG